MWAPFDGRTRVSHPELEVVIQIFARVFKAPVARAGEFRTHRRRYCHAVCQQQHPVRIVSLRVIIRTQGKLRTRNTLQLVAAYKWDG